MRSRALCWKLGVSSLAEPRKGPPDLKQRHLRGPGAEGRAEREAERCELRRSLCWRPRLPAALPDHPALSDYSCSLEGTSRLGRVKQVEVCPKELMGVSWCLPLGVEWKRKDASV